MSEECRDWVDNAGSGKKRIMRKYRVFWVVSVEQANLKKLEYHWFRNKSIWIALFIEKTPLSESNWPREDKKIQQGEKEKWLVGGAQKISP